MRAAAIFGPNASGRNLQAFKESGAIWQIGLPKNSSDADAILIFGGDGTVHRHLAELVRLQLPVLVVPCGSGNDFARALGLRRKKAALAAWNKFAANRNNVREIDLGVITPARDSATKHYFCCVGGVGLDAEVARRANHLPRWLRGHGGYAMSLFPALFQFAPVPMWIGTGENSRNFKPTILAAFANGQTYGGGMKIAPNAKLDDGLLDICVVRALDPFKLFCLFPTIYFGRHVQVSEVDYQQSASVKIETEYPLDVYADGEYVCKTPVEATAVPGALRVIVP